MQTIEQFINDFQQEYQATGLIATVFTNHGEVKYVQDFGYRDQVAKTKINTDTLFGIASMTKSMTALAIMKLVAENKLQLTDPVAKYIPTFVGQTEEPILIHHLLTHSAGLYPQHRTTIYEMMAELHRDMDETQDLAYDTELAVKGTERVVQFFNNPANYIGKPGEYLSYSNDSYGLLSTIITQVGNYNTYAEYMKHEIFEPLQMTRSTIEFIAPLHDDNVETQYEKREGKMQTIHDFYDTAFVLMGGGAAKSTITDLIKYVCLYLNKGYNVNTKTQFMAEEILQLMSEPYITYNNMSKYGYGLSIDDVAGTPFVGHGGALPGVSSQMLWSTQHQLGVVVLCNTSDVPVSIVAERLLCQFCQLPIMEPNHLLPQTITTKISGHYQTPEDEDVYITAVEQQPNYFNIKIGETIREAYAISPSQLCIPGKYRNSILEFYFKKDSPFALKLGGRILKKM